MRGFTLIELVIVAAIIVVLVAVSSPLFRKTFTDIELRDSAYNLSKVIIYGQNRAVIEEVRYRLALEPDNNLYYLLVETEEEDAVVWEKAGGRLGRNFILPDDVYLRSEKQHLTFELNGRCEKATIYLVSKRKKGMEIETRGSVGDVRVSEIMDAADLK